MDYLINNYQWILGIAAVISVYITFVLLPQLKENDVKNVYQSLGEPYLLWQQNDRETDYWGRYEREKMRFIDSKNRWAVIQTPVIPFPMNFAWEFEWFGEKHYASTIGLSNAEYQRAGIRFLNQMEAIWYQKTAAQFGTKEIMEIAKNQKPINPEKIWQYAN